LKTLKSLTLNKHRRLTVMKKLLYPLVIFSILFTIGCEDDKAAEEDVNPLVGVWEGTELKIIHGDGAQETYQYGEDTDMGTVTYIFGADGIYTHTSVSSNGTITSSGTWSLNDGILTFVDGDKTDIVDFTLSDNTLTLTIEVGEDDMPMTMVVTFIRQ
jgi:hypothetical protein